MTNKDKILNVLKNHKKAELLGILQIVPIHYITAIRCLKQLEQDGIIKIQRGKHYIGDYNLSCYDKNAIVYKLQIYKQQNIF
jgi:predicted ArsR family transcriptional regulator